jgi:poly(U)-specific endoribonuclease
LLLSVAGFHNWINFHYLERKGDIHYLGFVPSRAGGPRLANVSHCPREIKLLNEIEVLGECITKRSTDVSSLSQPDGKEHVISIRFKFAGHVKMFSTSFIGTSPEFEVSLYTLLFFLKRENTELVVDDIRLNIKVYDYYKNGERELGSAFPEIMGPADDDDDK